MTGIQIGWSSRKFLPVFFCFALHCMQSPIPNIFNTWNRVTELIKTIQRIVYVYSVFRIDLLAA